jgi:hypothetical protein
MPFLVLCDFLDSAVFFSLPTLLSFSFLDLNLIFFFPLYIPTLNPFWKAETLSALPHKGKKRNTSK